MKLQYLREPFPHVIYHDVFTDGELDAIWKELEFFDGKYPDLEHSGTGKEENGDYKGVKEALWLSGFGQVPYEKFSIVEAIRMALYVFDGAQWEDKWIGDMWRSTTHDDVLVCKYPDGGYHTPHRDKATFTNFVWVHKEPKTFYGGNLYFPEYDNYQIKVENNKAVSIISSTMHGVSPIRGDGRYCLSNFMTIEP